MAAKKRGLGRGLDALLSGPGKAKPAPAEADGGESLRSLPVEQLQPGKYQPRTGMDPARLAELADSIRAQGLIQPIVVRAVAGGRYEIIAGERRWRAAQQAGMSDVPVVLREVDDRAVIAMSLIENIQREDLNPLEEAQALARLIEEFDLTHQQAAEAVGRGRSAVSNLLRLLDMPEEIRALVERRELEMGHARALLTLQPQAAVALAREAAAEGLSVREVERRVQRIVQGRLPEKGSRPARPSADADIQALENELSERLNARVSVQHGRAGKGKLVVHYQGLDALEGILEKLRAE
ncbi:ParB/RepB/Spo0J family partition protein [Alkalisalibacterium limincola]|uniref:Probable chromosome-partitioning protein ParB n=1 Tax=Alkalisalibacterium limincola TaxID=2699169 RepID=A0A5C8KSI2_9GAMM|nr:ParB/RepB/Spo0J family partition protein [Alkalisalibacterium limincola]TXK62262.1 ParB/RepB/Spo0J family partition protein [Alkalisalibacterium limincola]